MKLLTAEIIKALPPLYSNEDRGTDALAVVKFFDPLGSWKWYATEGGLICPRHGECDCLECPKETWTEFLFFGLVDGCEKELGYFSLSELQSIQRPLGLGIERDRYWTPRPIKELMQ